jgi:cytidylate kinase
VRDILVKLQRKIGAELGSFVTEGRDQGSVVFPDADVKFYIDAPPEVRARRRADELSAAGEAADYPQVLQDMIHRDHRDSTRAVAPLIKPPDAIEITTAGKEIPEVTAELLRYVQQQKAPNPKTQIPNKRQ